jgi:DNA-binding NtrC family response regulator
MPFRIVARLGEKTMRLTLAEGTNLVGSREDCALRLDHPTVSRTHAEIVVTADRVLMRDLDSKNGTFVEGRRVSVADLGPGAEVVFGQVPARLEHVEADDLAAALRLSVAGAPAVATPPAGSTVHTKPLEDFVLRRLPALLELLVEGASPERVAQACGAALYETLPVLSVEVVSAGGGEDAILFTASRDLDGPEPTEVVAGGARVVRARFPRPALAEPFRPLVECASRLIAIAAREATAVPRATYPQAPARPPEPATLVPSVQRLYADAARVARGDVGVLISGESGTGKEVLARFLHAASPRAGRAFVALNCAALPRDLLEAELFGIERGVATGVEARAGKFELAHEGTLFLDEIGDMSLETQAKLLRVLQERSVHRLGSVAARPADVRIVAATNRDMKALLSERLFREDLYFRIATWTVELPALRMRREDIPGLAVHFLTREAARIGVGVAGISRAALDRLVSHDWPGNIRQLENEMARAVLFLGDGELLDSGRLAPEVGRAAPARGGGRLEDTLAQVEGEEIRKAVEAEGGDVERAAERLGMGRSTLYRRMRALGLAGGDPAVSDPAKPDR